MDDNARLIVLSGLHSASHRPIMPTQDTPFGADEHRYCGYSPDERF
jgi:hypothetical protein